jgi:hypothetical protein
MVVCIETLTFTLYSGGSMSELTREDRIAILEAIKRREAVINHAIITTEAIFASFPDRISGSQDKDPRTNQLYQIGVEFGGYKWERLTSLPADHPQLQRSFDWSPQHMYDRYRIYKITPVWHMLFGVFVRSERSKPDAYTEKCVVECFHESILPGEEDDLEALAIQLAEYDEILLSRIKQLQIEMPVLA